MLQYVSNRRQPGSLMIQAPLEHPQRLLCLGYLSFVVVTVLVVLLVDVFLSLFSALLTVLVKLCCEVAACFFVLYDYIVVSIVISGWFMLLALLIATHPTLSHHKIILQSNPPAPKNQSKNQTTRKEACFVIPSTHVQSRSDVNTQHDVQSWNT